MSVALLVKYWGPSLPPAEDEEDSLSILAACTILVFPLARILRSTSPTTNFLLYFQGKEKDNILRRLLGITVIGIEP